MEFDKRKTYIFSLSTLAALLIALFAPVGSGRIIAAFLLLPAAIVGFILIRKRLVPSIHSNEVLVVMGASGFIYVLFYHLPRSKLGQRNRARQGDDSPINTFYFVAFLSFQEASFPFAYPRRKVPRPKAI